MGNVSPAPKNNLSTVDELCNAPQSEGQYPSGRIVVDFNGTEFATVTNTNCNLASGPQGRWIIGFHGFEESYMHSVPDHACVINPWDRGSVVSRAE